MPTRLRSNGFAFNCQGCDRFVYVFGLMAKCVPPTGWLFWNFEDSYADDKNLIVCGGDCVEAAKEKKRQKIRDDAARRIARIDAAKLERLP